MPKSSKIDQLKRFTRLFKVLIFHDDSDVSLLSESMTRIFAHVTHQDIGSFKSKMNPSHYHLLIFCGRPETLQTHYTDAMSSQFKPIATAVLSPEEPDLDLYRFGLQVHALHVGIIPHSEQAFLSAMKPIIPPMRKRFNEMALNERFKQMVEGERQYSILYRDERPVYLSPALRKAFEIDDIEAYMQHRLFRQIGSAMHDHDDTFQQLLTTDEGITLLLTSTLTSRQDQLLSLIPLDISLDQIQSGVMNRISFIEELKDRFISQEIEEETSILVIVSIDNSDKIIKSANEAVHNEILLELLNLFRSLFDSDIRIAQWYKNVFAFLPSSNNMDQLKTLMEKVNKASMESITVEGMSPILTSYVIAMDTLELNGVIELADHLHQKQLTRKYLDNVVHHEISSNKTVADGKEDVHYYLEKLMLAKSELKLLNFYKGISICTGSKIIKMDNNTLYVLIEKMQGYAMKLEESVVLQATNLPYDVLAKVKLVDIKKKIAILTDFRALDTTANNRRHIRVQIDHRMPVSVSHPKGSFSALIHDISIKSIACIMTGSQTIPEAGTRVKLKFQLPSERFETALVRMEIDAYLIFTKEEKKGYRIIFEMDIEEPYESYLIEYIYARQQAIINEVKQIASKL